MNKSKDLSKSLSKSSSTDKLVVDTIKYSPLSFSDSGSVTSSESLDIKVSKDGKDIKVTKDTKVTKVVKDTKDVKEVKVVKEVKEVKEPKETKKKTGVITVETTKEFNNYIENSNKLVVVDFHAKWCGPCKKIAPFVEQLSTTLTDVIFLKVDVEELEDVSEQENIESMPTFCLYKKGKRVDEMVGANIEKLKILIKSNLLEV